MTATPGNAIDFEYIEKAIREAAEKFGEENIKGIAYDRWSATDVVQRLTYDRFPMDQFGQGYVSMSEPTKELERMAIKGELRHGGNPVLRWMMSNVQLETDAAQNIKVSKKRSREKVDGVVALVMAIGEWMTLRGSGSVYAERGVISMVPFKEEIKESFEENDKHWK
jgi:phage terminase large subunit-like protein